MTPPDMSLRQLAQGTLRPPALWARLHQIADEVTSLLIQVEELQKINQELVERINRAFVVMEKYDF